MGEAEARLRAAGCPKISLQIRSSNAEAVRVLSHARVCGGRRCQHGQAPHTGLTRIAPEPASSINVPQPNGSIAQRSAGARGQPRGAVRP